MKIGFLEASLIQMLFYAAVFFINSYIGLLLCLVICAIATGILFLALISEMVERSKVPKSYFKYMVTAIISPAVVALVFVAFDPSALNWMNE